MKKTNKNLLAVTAVAAALLLTGCASAETASAVRNLALNARSAQHNKPAETQEYDREDNTVEYEYTKDGVEYEVETDATTGEVKEVETEPAETKPEQKEKSEPKPQKTTKNVTLAEAKKIAYNHAGVNTNNLYDVSAELDDDVYEVEFSSKGTEYNYKVSKAGKVLSHYTEKDDDYVKPTPKPQATPKPQKTTKNVTLAEAKKIAYNHAGVNTNNLYDVSAELDDGVYEVEFSSKGTEYNYKISKAGKVLSHYTEKDDDYVKPTPKPQATPKPQKTTKNVTLAEAKKIAYNHAGVNTNNLYDVSAELDDGVYEVEFSSKGTEYNYKVSKAGKVLSHYTEKDDDYVSPSKKASNITKAKAKSIALNHAGVSADSIRSYEIELDDGVYEISFEKGRTEYEYKINAKKGEVLRATKEKDD